MADLRCKADSCTYNKNEYCCKGDIMVGGKQAVEEDDTCCDSFAVKRGDTFTSGMEHPYRTISIDCEAVKCKYNTDYKCYAEHVDIKGVGAQDTKNTSCATFSEKQNWEK